MRGFATARACAALVLVITAALALALPAAAEDGMPADAAGRWALTAEGHVVMLLTLTQEGTGWHARLAALHGSFDGDAVSDVGDASPDRALTLVRATPEALYLVQHGIAGGGPVFVFRLAGSGVAEWRIENAPSGSSLVFHRTDAAARLATGLDPARRYALDAPWPDNAAMTRLFDADQHDRAAGTAIDWSVVGPADVGRRSATQALLDADALRSGTDFYHAAYVFQHGAVPGDFLKAHALAVIAAARGRRDAAWIAAATLDRYLMNIGQKQVYGTQFSWSKTMPATQEPYDRTLLSDALRRATGVPPLAEQEERRAGYERDRGR